MVAIKHPARNYIAFLISQRIYDTKGVVAKLSDLGLPVPNNDFDRYTFQELTKDILRVRAEMTFPVGFNPRDNPRSDQTEAWLQRWRVRDMWAQTPATRVALELLGEAQIRHQLELLLLGPLDASSIAERISARFGLPFSSMNAAIVKTYSHYFWDSTAMNTAQWGAFIQTHYSASRFEFEAALSAPRNAAGAALTIAIADKDPQSLSPADRYETASAMAFGMLMMHSLSSEAGTGHTYAALASLNMMRMADDELAKHRGASVDLIDELRRLNTVYDKKKPLQITEASYIQRPVIDAQNPEVIDVPNEGNE